MVTKHHVIPKHKLYLPGVLIACSSVLLFLGLRNLAFLLLGVVLIVVLVIHTQAHK